jgi:hypothetical protein
MLTKETFIQDWRERMGALTPLTEDSVVAYINRREDQTTLARNEVRASACGHIAGESDDDLSMHVLARS